MSYNGETVTQSSGVFSPNGENRISTGNSFEVLNEFFSNAFSYLEGEKEKKSDVYRVFIARRCFVLACDFLRENSGKYDREILDSVVSDGGFRIVVQEIAEKFYKNNNYRCVVLLFDDILIHGRAVGSFLSSAENIFVSTYELYQADSEMKYSEDELRDIFLSFVTVITAYKNTQPTLLKERYRQVFLINRVNEAEPNVWRSIISDIAEGLFVSDIPNAAFVPAIRINNSCFPYTSEEIRAEFSEYKNRLPKEIRFCDNNYRGRTIDSYIYPVSSSGQVRSVMTLRCTKDYIVPFVFLPSFSSERFDYLVERIIDRIYLSDYRNSSMLARILYKKKESWDNSDFPDLNVLFIELINAVISSFLLRAFLDEIGVDSRVSSFNGLQEYIENATTVNIIMRNYAHDKEVEKLITALYNPNNRPLFSLADLKLLLLECTESESYIVNEIYPTTLTTDKKEIIDKICCNLERTVFDYGIESEKIAHNLSIGSLSPSIQSINYFSFPSENQLEQFLNTCYNSNDWMLQNADVSNVLALVLQMMDAGIIGLRVGKNDNHYIQCIKVGEPSLTTVTYDFAQYLPLLNEIEQKCYRQSRVVKTAFDEEFDYFIQESKQCKQLDGFERLLCESVARFRNYLVEMVNELHDSGQRCRDYMFLVEKLFKNKKVIMSINEYIDICKKLFFKVIY